MESWKKSHEVKRCELNSTEVMNNWIIDLLNDHFKFKNCKWQS